MQLMTIFKVFYLFFAFSIPFSWVSAKDSIAMVADHRYGAVSTWSHETDTCSAKSFFAAEAAAFKYNMAVTVFDTSIHDPGNLSILQKQAANKTGRIDMQVYLATDAFISKSGKTHIPDYHRKKWSQASVNAGFKVKPGDAKRSRYPNHGQQFYDVSKGEYGYDLINNRRGKIDSLTGILAIHRKHIYRLTGKYPSSGSYRNGQTGAAYGTGKFFLGMRTSAFTGNISYGKSKERKGYLGSSIPYELTHQQAQKIPSTTRAGDMKLPIKKAVKHCKYYLKKSIKINGWYRDFQHWHNTKMNIPSFLKFQRNIMGKNDVVTLSFGEALEHKFLRDMASVSSQQDSKGITLNVNYRDPYGTLPLETISIPLSVKVDLTGTSLEGKEIVSKEALGIRKISTNHFVIEVPFNHKEESVAVHLTEANGNHKYMDFTKPVIKQLARKNGFLLIKTDKKTNTVVFIAPKNKGIDGILSAKRSNSMTKQHKINIRDIKENKYDIYVGVISSQGQSILLNALSGN